MKKGDSTSASLQSLYNEVGFALGEGRDAASGSFPNVEMDRRMKVPETTPEGSTTRWSLGENLTLLPEERALIKTREEMDGFCPQKLKKNVLPSISKGAEFAFEKAPWKNAPFSDRAKPLKPPPPQTAPRVKKSKRNTSRDITPWVANSLLDTSFGAIPPSLEQFPRRAGPPLHLPCGAIKPWCGVSRDPTAESRNQERHQGTGSSAGPQSLQAAAEGPAQRSGKDGWCRRRLRDKLRGGTKLPPVQSISNLSFSRNYTFSFFELPQHQSQQHRAQGTRAAYLLMKQLHY